MEKYSVEPDIIRQLIFKLPDPVAIYKNPGARFMIYRAKDLYRHGWNNGSLKRLVAISRETYSRYGDRPAFDPYDAKSAIYLVRAIYKKRGISEQIEEWLTVRMVPGDGKPLGLAEPEIYWHAGKRIDYWMKRKIGTEHFWNHIASSSRMCGIHPYAVHKNGKAHFLESPQHSFTPICFALIHRQFVLDYPVEKFPYRYITAVLRPDSYKRMLGYVVRKKTFLPGHRPAYVFLGMRRDDIRVKRDIYSYRFPLYWLDGKKLLGLLNRLRANKKNKPLSTLEVGMLSGLARQTKRPILIAGVTIEPKKLRRLIDRSIPDVPELKITEAGTWYRDINALLRAANVTQIC